MRETKVKETKQKPTRSLSPKRWKEKKRNLSQHKRKEKLLKESPRTVRETNKRERDSNNWRKEKKKKASKVGEVNYVVQYLNWRIKRGNVHSEREKKNRTNDLNWFVL